MWSKNVADAELYGGQPGQGRERDGAKVEFRTCVVANADPRLADSVILCISTGTKADTSTICSMKTTMKFGMRMAVQHFICSAGTVTCMCDRSAPSCAAVKRSPLLRHIPLQAGFTVSFQ